jgi:hypothetical protein
MRLIGSGMTQAKVTGPTTCSCSKVSDANWLTDLCQTVRWIISVRDALGSDELQAVMVSSKVWAFNRSMIKF